MLLQDPNYSASCLLLLYLAIIYCNATFCNLFGKNVYSIKLPLNIISIRIGDLKWILQQSSS